MITYKKAGVDIDAGNELVRRIKKMSPLIGGFAGMVPLQKSKYAQPMLVGCTDGVGTKLKIAFLSDQHDTVGIDLVAMNVNDLLCCGATALFFLDYFACGKLNVGVAEKVIKGIMDGCRQARCTLLGGETAEMPGFYEAGEYDLAGFAVGVVDKAKTIDGKSIRPGDIVYGLASSGFHSNGYSLIRKVIPEKELARRWKEFLTPTQIYTSALDPILVQRKVKVKGMAHITGGGFIDNIPRVIPKGLRVRITKGSWKVPELFLEVQKRAKLSDDEIYRTLNMGIGLSLVVARSEAAKFEGYFPKARAIGVVESGAGEIKLV